MLFRSQNLVSARPAAWRKKVDLVYRRRKESKPGSDESDGWVARMRENTREKGAPTPAPFFAELFAVPAGAVNSTRARIFDGYTALYGDCWSWSYHIELSWRLVFSAFACSWSLAAGSGRLYICLHSLNGTYV